MKGITLTLICMAMAASLIAQTKADYETALNKFQGFYNHSLADSIFNMFSKKMKSEIPMDKTTAMLGNLREQFGDMKSFAFTKEKDGFNFYKTMFNTETLSFVVALNKEHKFEAFRILPYKADAEAAKQEKSNIVLKTAKGNIYGTLVLPNGGKKVPVVLIIAGSGPTDRNGNNGSGLHSDAYLQLSDSLQKEGIASVRYDKRGIGESAEAVKKENNVTFDDMVNDAAGFVKMLKEDARFSKVVVLGHSEGSLIGMIVAAREKVAGYISVAGISERADKIIEKQLSTQSKELTTKATIILDSLKKGYTVTNIDPKLEPLFRPSVQPYMRSWLKYDPSGEIKKLKKHVLILQGSTDIQVGVEEAQKLKEANSHASLKIITGMNHILKQAPEDRKENIATYSKPGLPLCPGLVPAVVTFVKEL